MAKKVKKFSNYRDVRIKRRLSQQEFWSRIGVTQSGGSRYETRDGAPEPTKTVVNIAYGENPLAIVAELRGVTIEELIANGK